MSLSSSENCRHRHYGGKEWIIARITGVPRKFASIHLAPVVQRVNNSIHWIELKVKCLGL